MNFSAISEWIISTVVGTLISSLIIFLARFIFYKKSEESSLGKPSVSLPFFKDVFLISLFITSFLVVLTFFSFIYSWQVPNGAYLLVASVCMAFATKWAYNNQCPRCRAVFHGKSLVNKETLREEKRPYKYRDETRYLYTDGAVKNNVFHGPLKTIMETYRIEKEYYKCLTCDYKWDETFERNLDEKNRPKPEIIRTNFRNPNDVV